MPRRLTALPTLTLLGLLTLTLLGSTGCTPTDQAVISQANQVHGSLEPAVIRDRDVQGYMDAIGDRIISAAVQYDREKGHSQEKGFDNSWMNDVRFHLVNSKTLNAFTTGGQHIYIYNQ